MIDELASRAEWDEAQRQGYRGTYAEWKHDKQDWLDFRAEFLAGQAGTNDFYVWKEDQKKARDIDLSFQIAKEMGFTGTRNQWAKFINTMRGPSAYDIWMTNNAENIQDIFGKDSITEKEWADMLFSADLITKIVTGTISRTFVQVTDEEIDSIVYDVLKEKEGE